MDPRTLVVLLILLFVHRAHAGPVVVYKCRADTGRVHYQDAPCHAGTRHLASWQAPRDPQVSPAMLRSAAGPRARARPAGSRSYRAQVRAQRPEPDRCAEAKARRDAIERRVGLARTYELLTDLSRDVFDACR